MILGMKLAFACVVAAGPLWAEGCPDAPDHRVALEKLIAEAQTAPDEFTGRAASNAMWLYWAQAPDEAAQTVLDKGMERRAAYDFLAALEQFDRLVGYCPEFAEGYNQRAFVNFLREDYDAALPDLERALELNPRHVAAMSGRALVLMALGRTDEGQAALREALKLNPWLPERGMLLPPKGKDI